MSKQIVMGVLMEELNAVGINRDGSEWAFFLIEDMKIDAHADCVNTMKQWEAEGAENIGNDLSRLTKKKKEGGYVELAVVQTYCGIYVVAGVDDDGYFSSEGCIHLSDCPSIVGFGGILFDGRGEYFDILSDVALGSKTKPHTPLKARFWREG